MEQGKSKYEVAQEILKSFNAVAASVEAAKDAKTKTEKVEKALDWYLEQYKKVLNAMDKS
jgi:hypothetical protein